MYEAAQFCATVAGKLLGASLGIWLACNINKYGAWTGPTIRSIYESGRKRLVRKKP